MPDRYLRLAERALADEPPSHDEALWLMGGEDVELLPLLHAAFVPRREHFGRKVMIHVLNNLQNGLCAEDCGYCAQSRDSQAAIRKYPMKSDEEILQGAERAAAAGAKRYCMVLSGRGPTLDRSRRLAELVREIKQRYPVEVCLSVGLMGDQQARILAEAGLDRLNHNLNTSASHYTNVCKTHDHADRVATLEAAKRCGLSTCSGLIVGMGERDADLVEVAFELRELEVPSIPVNFLIPIPGNPIQSDGSLTPERCLRALCLMRLVNPRAEVRLAAGREGHLRSMQGLALYPANSVFAEGYLTTRGDALADTRRMIREAGFEVDGEPSEGDDTLAPKAGFRLGNSAEPLLKPEIAEA